MADTAKDKLKDLTEKQKAFCREYVFDWNGTRAYKVAYPDAKYAGAQASASRMLKKKSINEYIASIYPEHDQRKNDKRKEEDEYVKTHDIGYIYIINIKGTNFYKIGRSMNGGASRLKSMQTGMPYDLILIKNIKCENQCDVERGLHKQFKKYLVRGEWFELDIDLLNFVISAVENKRVSKVQYEIIYN